MKLFENLVLGINGNTPIETKQLASHRKKILITNNFRIAYKIANKNQSFHHFETEIDMQEINVVEMGRIIHSTNAYINNVNDISEGLKKTVIKTLLYQGIKCRGLLMNESQ